MPIVKFLTPHAGEIGVGHHVYGVEGNAVVRGCVTGFEFTDDGGPEPVTITLTIERPPSEELTSYTRKSNFDLNDVFADEREAWQLVISRLRQRRAAESNEVDRLTDQIQALAKAWDDPERKTE